MTQKKHFSDEKKRNNNNNNNNNNETINNVAVNVETLDEEAHLIIAQLNKILAGGRNTDRICFKKQNNVQGEQGD